MHEAIYKFVNRIRFLIEIYFFSFLLDLKEHVRHFFFTHIYGCASFTFRKDGLVTLPTPG